jgi:hypothetical protein
MILGRDINDSWLISREMLEHTKSAIATRSDELLAVWCVAEESGPRGISMIVSKFSRQLSALNNSRAGRPRNLVAIVSLFWWTNMPLLNIVTVQTLWRERDKNA